MKSLFSPVFVAALMTGALPTAFAQNPMPNPRAGLWEHGFTMKSQGGQMESAMKQMQQTMANLPPGQRKMMEDMMAKQGIGLGAGGNSVKVCVTKEEAQRGEPPPPQEGCSQQFKRSGNIWQVSFQCKGPPPSSGDGEITLLNPTAYSGNFNILTEVQGKQERVQMSQTGKWLSADCGNIRPPAAGR